MLRTKSQKSSPQFSQHSQRTRSKTKKADKCVYPDNPDLMEKEKDLPNNTHSSTPRSGCSPAITSNSVSMKPIEYSPVDNDNNSDCSDLHSCSEEFPEDSSDTFPSTDLPYLGNITIPDDKSSNSPREPQALLVDILKAQNKTIS